MPSCGPVINDAPSSGIRVPGQRSERPRFTSGAASLRSLGTLGMGGRGRARVRVCGNPVIAVPRFPGSRPSSHSRTLHNDNAHGIVGGQRQRQRTLGGKTRRRQSFNGTAHMYTQRASVLSFGGNSNFSLRISPVRCSSGTSHPHTPNNQVCTLGNTLRWAELVLVASLERNAKADTCRRRHAPQPDRAHAGWQKQTENEEKLIMEEIPSRPPTAYGQWHRHGPAKWPNYG